MKFSNYNPFSLSRADLNEWLESPTSGLPALSRFFGGLLDGSALGRLAADVHEDKDNYYASFEVPGVKKEDVKVEVTDRVLTVTVNKKDKTGGQESTYSTTRSISVPESVKAEGISAKVEDGILTVTLPKGDERKGRVIDIA